MLIVNSIFTTSFFGLTFNDNYNIYNMVLVNNAYISALIYLIGLIMVLILGYLFQKIINKNIS